MDHDVWILMYIFVTSTKNESKNVYAGAIFAFG